MSLTDITFMGIGFGIAAIVAGFYLSSNRTYRLYVNPLGSLTAGLVSLGFSVRTFYRAQTFNKYSFQLLIFGIVFIVWSAYQWPRQRTSKSTTPRV